VGDDAVCEVGGHARTEIAAPHDEGDGAASCGEVERGLAGGVGSADDGDRVRRALAGLQFGGGVEDSGADEVRPSFQRQGAVARACGDDDSPGGDFGVVGQDDAQFLTANVQLGHFAGAGDTRAELQRLHGRAAGQVGAADA
jgi:hypothetical protein